MKTLKALISISLFFGFTQFASAQQTTNGLVLVEHEYKTEADCTPSLAKKVARMNEEFTSSTWTGSCAAGVSSNPQIEEDVWFQVFATDESVVVQYEHKKIAGTFEIEQIEYTTREVRRSSEGKILVTLYTKTKPSPKVTEFQYESQCQEYARSGCYEAADSAVRLLVSCECNTATNTLDLTFAYLQISDEK